MFGLGLRKGGSGERGQTLVLVALVMLVLLAVGAMAIDVGGVMWSRGTQQNGADAAALAGVTALPDSPPLARQIALEYGTNNGFTNGVDGVTVNTQILRITGTGNEEACADTSTDCNAIEVTITRIVPPGLRAAVGGGNITVPAQAVAIVAPALPYCDIWPWGIERDAILYDPYKATGEIVIKPFYETYGEKVMLKVPPAAVDEIAPGNFLALAPGDSSGANDYRNNIKYGACIDRLDTIRTETGNMAGPTTQGVLTQADSAIRQSEPCYDAAMKSPDSTYWEVSETNPYTESPFTSQSTTFPFALGGPTSQSPCGNDNNNTGPPTAADPFPGIVLPSTTRVGIVPILKEGTFASAHGSTTAEIVGFAAFYLIGLEQEGAQYFVVGGFLKKVVVKAGKPAYGKDPNGPVGFFLWR